MSDNVLQQLKREFSTNPGDQTLERRLQREIIRERRNINIFIDVGLNRNGFGDVPSCYSLYLISRDFGISSDFNSREIFSYIHECLEKADLIVLDGESQLRHYLPRFQKPLAEVVPTRKRKDVLVYHSTFNVSPWSGDSIVDWAAHLHRLTLIEWGV